MFSNFANKSQYIKLLLVVKLKLAFFIGIFLLIFGFTFIFMRFLFQGINYTYLWYC